VTWLPARAEGATPFERVLGLRPDLLADYRAFDALLWSGRTVDPALLDLCRLRIAGLHGCEEELLRVRVMGPGDRRRAHLGRWREEVEAFSARERAALALAEKFALEPHGVSDDDVAALTSRLSPAEFVALAEGLAMSDGFARFQVVLGVGRDGARPRAAARRARASRPAHERSSTARLAAPEPRGEDAISASVLAHQPDLLRAFLRFYGTLWSHGVVDHPTKEVLRLRNARVTDCNYCRNVRFAEARRQGLGEEMVELIDDGYEGSALPERHKVALGLADAFLLDPHGLDVQARDALLAHFSPPEIVEMTAGLALFMGFAKITVVLGREPVAMATTVVPTPERPAG
jgi:AhpD family alkylhydroperoxidase